MSEKSPRPNADELTQQLRTDLFTGRITLDEMAEQFKADAERPVDLDMLREFCDCYEQRVCAYSAMLQAIIEIATDQHNPYSWRRREREVDEHVQQMLEMPRLWPEQVRAVFEFLTELRADSGQGPVQLKDSTHSTAHLLAGHFFEVAAEAWKSCQEIAGRSRSDPSYLYATTASKLFLDVHLEKLPRPNDITALLDLERVIAMRALRNSGGPQQMAEADAAKSIGIHADTVTVTSQSVSVESEQIEMNAARRGRRSQMEQPWDEEAPEYIWLKEAVKLTDEQLGMSRLSKSLKPDGEMRYMRKGHRCRVHIGDFRSFMKSRQSDPKWAKAYMSFLQASGKGNVRFFWRCPACGHEQPDNAAAQLDCPKCGAECEISGKRPPTPSR